MHKISNNLQNMKSKHPHGFYLICYLILFIVMGALCFSLFFCNGKSLIQGTDGSAQHMNALLYYSDWLKEVARNLFVHHRFEIPLWDFNVGYGSDILTTFNYYALGDPLTVLSVIVPSTYLGHFYNFLLVFRVFLAGGAFSIYALSRGNNRSSVLIGTIVYCFCGFVLTGVTKHPFFANPMIYFPLLLWGTDRIFAKKKPYLFIIMITISAVSNFYFLYMMGILLVIYAIFQYFAIYKKFSIKRIGTLLGKFAFFSAVGIFLSAIILLPVMSVLFSADRFSVQNYIRLFYEKKYYQNYLVSFLGGSAGYWMNMGYTGVTLVGVFVLFLKKKKNTALKIGFLLLTAFGLIPYMGHALNGFSYVSNRWVWAYALLCAYVLVKAIPAMPELTKKEKIMLVLMTMCYIALCVIFSPAKVKTYCFSMFLLCACVGMICLYSPKRYHEKYLQTGLLLVVCLNVFANAYTEYSDKGYTKEFVDLGKMITQYTENESTVVVDVADMANGVRYDQALSWDKCNTSIHTKVPSTNYYFSLTDGIITNFHNEVGLSNRANYRFSDMNSRTILDRLFSVKYFLIEGDKIAKLPYGFNQQPINTKDIAGKKYNLYQAKNFLPLGYTYDSYIPSIKYEDFSMHQKQEAILQGVVLEESSLDETNIDFKSKKLETKISAVKDAEVNETTIIARKKKAEIILEFEGEANSECYLNINNIRCRDIKIPERYTTKEWAALGGPKKAKALKSENQRMENTQFVFKATAGELSGNIQIKNEMNAAYSGKHDLIYNLGYTEKAVQKVSIVFSDPGYYSFDDFSIVCQPMTNIDRQTQKLGQETLQNIKMNTNRIAGDISLENAKILCLSIPYSSGWTLKTDGYTQELKKANGIFMAAELPAGNHHIELVYQTPLLKEGIILTCFGIVVFIAIVIYFKKQRVADAKSGECKK